MKLAFALSALACLSLYALPALAPVGQTGHLTTTAPKKDGSEHITLGYILPDETGNSSLTATVSGINGKKKNDADDEPTTPEEKAQAIADALQKAIDAEDQARVDQGKEKTGLSVSANLDSVDVSLPGGQITKLVKTNNTREPRDTSMVSPGEGQVAMGQASLGGSISGAPEEQTGTAQLWIQVGWQEYFVPTSQGMTLRELTQEAQRVLELDGHRVTVLGAGVLTVVLPSDAPIFGIGSDDRTLGINRFGTSVL